MRTVLAGDLGGTHCRLVYASVSGSHVSIEQEAHYLAGDYPDFETILSHFIEEYGSDMEPSAACFAVAGPVHGQRVKLTNLPWILDTAVLARCIGIDSVSLINDFAANGYSLSALEDNDWHLLQRGEPSSGTRAVLGAGTGLGMALVTGEAGTVQVLSSEGGHMDFAPVDEEQNELLRFLCQRQPRVSYEHVLSGPGLVRLYEYCLDRKNLSSTIDLRVSDAPALVSARALRENDPQALEALALFCRIYGSCAANLALVGLATGGVYLAGGIATKLMEVIERSDFLQAFNNKPPMQDLLQRIPVRIITNPRAGLLGAAWYAGNK